MVREFIPPETSYGVKWCVIFLYTIFVACAYFMLTFLHQ